MDERLAMNPNLVKSDTAINGIKFFNAVLEHPIKPIFKDVSTMNYLFLCDN